MEKDNNWDESSEGLNDENNHENISGKSAEWKCNICNSVNSKADWNCTWCSEPNWED